MFFKQINTLFPDKKCNDYFAIKAKMTYSVKSKGNPSDRISVNKINCIYSI